jgi:hypothetical protein
VLKRKKSVITASGTLAIKGKKFLELTDEGADACEKMTKKLLPKMGKKAPVCLELLGRLLAQADIMGCCFFECPGNTREAHTIQYLCARSSSFGRGALRLATMGFYDEALTLVRSLGEIANLMALFVVEKTSLDEWKASNRGYRRAHFSPAKVRDKLQKLSQGMPMDGERYRILCELSTHPVPELHPQAFSGQGKGMVGGIAVQPVGFLLVLDETTVLMASLVLLASLILKLPKETANAIKVECLQAVDAAGAVSLKTFRNAIWESDK